MLRRALLAASALATLGCHQAHAYDARFRFIFRPVGSGCPYPVDGGCASASAYTAPYTPSYLYSASNPLQFAYDTAQGGQLPTTATPTSAETVIRNGYMHIDGINIPWVDFPIASSDPADLIGAADYVDPTGVCVYSATGGFTFPSSPVFKCTPPSGTGSIASYIKHVDMTRLHTADATETALVQVVFGNGFSAGSKTTSVYFQDVKTKAVGSAATSAAGQPALFYAGSGTSGSPIAYIELNNVLCDGNYPNHAAGLGAWKCFDDNRTGARPTGSPVNPQWPVVAHNTLAKDFGLDPFTGVNGGDFTFINSWAFNVAAAGGSPLHGGAGAHGEIAERGTGAGTHASRNLTYINSGYETQSSLEYVQTTSPVYSTGQTNGDTITHLDLEHALFIMNPSSCTNAGPWSPTNPCSGSQAGEAFLSFGGPSEVQVLTALYVKADQTGSTDCFANLSVAVPGGSYVTAGQLNIVTSTITSVGADYAVWPGMILGDTGEATSHFTPVQITSYGSANNLATFGAYETSGVMTTDSPEYLISGNVVATTGPGSFFYVGPGQTGPLSSWQMTTTSAGGTNSMQTAGHQTVESLNNTSSCVPGHNPGCGSYNLASSSVNLPNTSSLVAWTGIDTIIEKDGFGNYTSGVFGGPWVAGGQGFRNVHFSDMAARTGVTTTSGKVHCPS